MQQVKVYQSLWAMERRRPDGQEWPLDVQLRMIRDAGFDGAGVRFFDYAFARDVTRTLKEYGITWQAQCYPQSVDDLKPIIEHVQELGADHINLQPDVRPYSIEECISLIEGWRRLAHNAGVAVHIETHRNRMTTDLLFTLRLLDCFPDLRLTGDISHYVVGREFAWPIGEEDDRHIRRILDNCWGFHGRVASREQIQVQISFAHHREWLDLFLAWWQYGFERWRERAPDDAVLTFLCELGPKEYAMTDRNGYELSDRWEEALMLKDLVREMWSGLEARKAA
ncbi:sugar phosphate isomerase/epimerase family protein [Candidatus Burkholderia verschuerenii]|uniref:sugar phosphate isomerase/epimerase family protein n=1 Tax=Candidatus Burkholderia verschuerenii TaxID=242163 RepID=UPI00067D2CF1|nr:TIM barrel protein [Candidatus Burkholderia verschuerenii]